MLVPERAIKTLFLKYQKSAFIIAKNESSLKYKLEIFWFREV
jgi:hypothetical protein